MNAWMRHLNLTKASRTAGHLTLALLTAASMSTSARAARADVGFALHAEGAATHVVGDRTSQFGWGGVGLLSPELVLARKIGIELPIGALGLSEAPHQNPAYARVGYGTAFFAMPGVRVRPFAGPAPGWGDAFWLAAGGGVADTGGLVRPVVDARVGVDLRVGPLALGPYFGFLELIDVEASPLRSSASLAAVGLHAAWEPRRAPPRVMPVRDAVEPDNDGAPEAIDTCPNGQPNADNCDEAEMGTVVVERPELFVDFAERILFALDSSRIRPGGYAPLREIAAALNEHQEYRRIEIQGHADDRGASAYNDRLSAARAKAVQAALVDMGADARRLDVAYFGNRRPRRPGKSEAARQQNRRVEFNLIRARFETVPAMRKPAAGAKEAHR